MKATAMLYAVTFHFMRVLHIRCDCCRARYANRLQLKLTGPILQGLLVLFGLLQLSEWLLRFVVF